MHVVRLFSCLIALTGSSRAVLNRGGESEIPHLVPELGPLFLFITYLDTDLFLNCQLYDHVGVFTVFPYHHFNGCNIWSVSLSIPDIADTHLLSIHLY